MISFDNTEIAFKSKSDKDLNWSYRLFKMIGKPWLVKMGSFSTHLAFKLRLPVKGLIKRTIFKQFCGGESISDCENKINELHTFHVGTILDYSVEGKTEAEDFDKTRDEIIATIVKAKNEEAIPFSVFKITGISRFELLENANESIDNLTAEEKEEYNSVLNRVDAICSKAFELNVPTFIDAEDSWIQNTIDRMADEMMEKYNSKTAIIYNTIQMYRHDRLEFLKTSHQKAVEKNYQLGVKLVRGAYMEKERARAKEKDYQDPIQPNKAATDKDFNLALTYIVENVNQISLCCGSHNEESSLYLAKIMEEKGIEKNDKRIYFAQLLGMSDHISFNLAHHGLNVAKYVPYGPIKEVMPYLIRRAQENTSVVGQMGRELSLIVKEKNRRKKV